VSSRTSAAPRGYLDGNNSVTSGAETHLGWRCVDAFLTLCEAVVVGPHVAITYSRTAVLVDATALPDVGVIRAHDCRRSQIR